MRQLQRRSIGEGESLGREADFSAPAAQCAASGGNDDLWVVVERNKQQEMQPRVPTTGSGQGYPARPIRIIYPFAAGSGNDGVARLVAQRLNAAWRLNANGNDRIIEFREVSLAGLSQNTAKERLMAEPMNQLF